MIRKTNCLLGLGGVAALLTGVAVWLSLSPKPGVTRENFCRLYQGISEQEAIAILDEPTTVEPDSPWKASRATTWEKDGCRVTLVFGTFDKAVAFGVCHSSDGSQLRLPPREPGFFERVRTFLGV